LAANVAKVFAKTPGIVGVDTSLKADAPRQWLQVRTQRAETLGIPVSAIARTVQGSLQGVDATYMRNDGSKMPVPVRLQLPVQSQVGLKDVLAMPMRAANGQLVPLSELVEIKTEVIQKPLFTKDLLPVSYVMGDMAGSQDSPLYGLFGIRANMKDAALPGQGNIGEFWIQQPSDTYREYAVKWDGESQITYETFRDMGTAYGVGLILIYLLVVAQFKSYLTPLVIMAPIPLTLIGVMPGHALLNSILLVDFIELQVAQGMDFKEAVIQSAAVRAQPIVLTGLAAMIGAFFILDDPIFNGLAVSLIFGILVSTLLTLVVIPVLYFSLFKPKESL
jgi:multidrug efflux pump subunit AcrB